MQNVKIHLPQQILFMGVFLIALVLGGYFSEHPVYTLTLYSWNTLRPENTLSLYTGCSRYQVRFFHHSLKRSFYQVRFPQSPYESTLQRAISEGV